MASARVTVLFAIMDGTAMPSRLQAKTMSKRQFQRVRWALIGLLTLTPRRLTVLDSGPNADRRALMTDLVQGTAAPRAEPAAVAAGGLRGRWLLHRTARGTVGPVMSPLLNLTGESSAGAAGLAVLLTSDVDA